MTTMFDPDSIIRRIDFFISLANEAETPEVRKNYHARIRELKHEFKANPPTYIRIPVSGRPTTMPDTSSLEDLQGTVGGYLESLAVASGHILYINDCIGHTKINPLASALADRLIYGDVVLTGWPDQEGNDGPIKPAIASMVLRTRNR